MTARQVVHTINPQGWCVVCQEDLAWLLDHGKLVEFLPADA